MSIITDIYNYEIQDPELYSKKSVINIVQLIIELRNKLFQRKLSTIANKKWPHIGIGTSPEQSPRASTFTNLTNNGQKSNDSIISLELHKNSGDDQNIALNNLNNMNSTNFLVLIGILVCNYECDHNMVDKYGDFYPLETQGMCIYSLDNPTYRIKTEQFNVDLSFQDIQIQAFPGTPIAVKGYFSSDLKNFTVTDFAYPNEVIDVIEEHIHISVPQRQKLLALKSKLPYDAIAFKALLTKLNIKSLILNQLQQAFGDPGQKPLEEVQQLAESGFTELGFDTVQQDVIISGILQIVPQIILLPGPDDCTGEAYPQDSFLQVLYEKSLSSNGYFGQNPFLATLFGKKAIIMDGLIAKHFNEQDIARWIVQSDHALAPAGVLFDYINTREDFFYISENNIQIILYLGAPNNKHYTVTTANSRIVKVIFIKEIGFLDENFNVYAGSLNSNEKI